jgi:hypothetical protein
MPALIATKNGKAVNRQREDQPAEQTDANGVEDESKGERGGSMYKGVTVAPSTTTAARIWT